MHGRMFTVGGLLVLLLATAVVYATGMTGGFLFDDFPNIVRAPGFPLTSLSADTLRTAVFSNSSGPTGRPLAMLSFALESYAFGLDPTPMKITNLVIHLANGVLVYALLAALLRRCAANGFRGTLFLSPQLVALAATALWLLAPINLTAVLFVVQRMESLSALFVLAGLLAYVHGRERMLTMHAGGALLAFAGVTAGTTIGTLAKETAVMLPVYALAIELVAYRGRDRYGFVDRQILWLFAITLVLPGLLGAALILPDLFSATPYARRPFDLWQRLLTEDRAMWSYIHWILLPQPSALTLYHDAYPVSTGVLTPWTTLPAILGLAGLLAGALWLRSRLPLVALGILWFLGGHLLVSTVLPLELVYEHRNYLPSIGVLLALLGAVLVSLGSPPPLKNARIGFVCALIVLFGVLTTLRASAWGNPLLLAWTEASQQPRSPRANYELGQTLTRLSADPSSPQFQLGMQSFTAAAKLPGAGLLPDQALIFLSAKYHLETPSAAWARLEDAIRNRPLGAQDVNALYSLVNCRIQGVCPLDDDRLGQALAAAARRYPQRADILTIYANYAANIAPNYPLAQKLMQRSVTLAPRNLRYWTNLATLQTALGLEQPAAESLKRVSELGEREAALAELTAAYRNRFGHLPDRSAGRP